MNAIFALQLQIQILVTQIQTLTAELPAADVQMIDWTPLTIATQPIPAFANEVAPTSTDGIDMVQ